MRVHFAMVVGVVGIIVVVVFVAFVVVTAVFYSPPFSTLYFEYVHSSSYFSMFLLIRNSEKAQQMNKRNKNQK